MKAISSKITIVPERGVSGVVLTNLAEVPARTILNGALNVYEERVFDATEVPIEEYAYTTEDLQQFEGKYVTYDGQILDVNTSDSSLELSVLGARFELDNIGEDLFLANIKDQAEVIRFIRNDIGEVYRVAYQFRQLSKINTVIS